MTVPIVKGARDLLAAKYAVKDAKTGDACAACGQGGDYRLKRSLQLVDGVRLMLCIDSRACMRRVKINA